MKNYFCETELFEIVGVRRTGRRANWLWCLQLYGAATAETQSGQLVTLFKPDDGIKYWKKQVEKYGPKQ
jgi:hypothetical protein